MRRSRHHHPMNPGCGAAHPAAPFRLAALATHPREGGGQVTWRRRTLPQTLPIPFCGGKGYHALQTCLPPLAGGRGSTKWWRGAADWRPYKKLAAKPPPSPSARRAVKPKNLKNLLNPKTAGPQRPCCFTSQILLSAGEVPAPAFSGGRRD